MNRPHFIINPAASAGRTGRSQGLLLKLIEDAFPGGFTLEATSHQGDATHITRKAIREGVDLIVAVGGDGTMNEVINGFFENGRISNQKAHLGLVCSGTAEDVARNLGLPAGLKDQIGLLANPATKHADLGRVRFKTKEGGEEERWFVNDCHPGIAAKVVERVTPGLKKLGGFLAFGLASTYTAMRYKGHQMTVTLDHAEVVEGRFLGVVVANGRYAGGGMDFAPKALIDDGFLDIVLIKDQSVPSRLLNFPKIYSGSHINLSWIDYRRARHVRVESKERVALEADGELLGFVPCEAEVAHHALRVCVPH